MDPLLVLNYTDWQSFDIFFNTAQFYKLLTKKPELQAAVSNLNLKLKLTHAHSHTHS